MCIRDRTTTVNIISDETSLCSLFSSNLLIFGTRKYVIREDNRLIPIIVSSGNTSLWPPPSAEAIPEERSVDAIPKINNGCSFIANIIYLGLLKVRIVQLRVRQVKIEI